MKRDEAPPGLGLATYPFVGLQAATTTGSQSQQGAGDQRSPRGPHLGPERGQTTGGLREITGRVNTDLSHLKSGKDTATTTEGWRSGRKRNVTIGDNGAKGKGKDGSGRQSESKTRSGPKSKTKGSHEGKSQAQGRYEETGPGYRSPETARSRREEKRSSEELQGSLGQWTHRESIRDELGLGSTGQEDSSRRSPVLPPSMQGGGVTAWDDDGRGPCHPEDPAHRDNRRRAVEAPKWEPAAGTEAGALSGRLQSRGSVRGSDPRSKAQKASGRPIRGGVGRQPGKGNPSRRRRRAGEAAGPFAASWRRSRARRKAGGENQERKRKRQEEGKGEGETKEKEKREEETDHLQHIRSNVHGEGSPGWNEAKTVFAKDSKELVPRDRHGSFREGEEQGLKDGKKICEEEGKKEQQRIGFRPGKFAGSESRRRRGLCFPTGSKSERDSRSLPRSPLLPSDLTDEVQPPARPWRRGEGSWGASSECDVLPSGITEKSIRRSGARAPEFVRHCRSIDQSKAGTGPRHRPSKVEIGRVNLERYALERISAPRAVAAGAEYSDLSLGDEGGTEGDVGGVPDALVVVSAGRPRHVWAKRRRKAQRRQQGGQPKGRLAQGRKRQRNLRERRWQEEGRGWQQTQLKGPEHIPDGVQKVVSPDSGDIAGNFSPEPEVLKGGQTDDWPYEGGKALAPQAATDVEPFHQSSETGLNPYEALVKSMIEATPPFEGAEYLPNVAVSFDASDEGSDPVRRGANKNSGKSVFVGSQLSSCCFHLLEALLGVLPLRSQDMGRRNSFDIFPLPTSRSSFLELDRGLSECELAWFSCLTVSLNSLWGDAIVFSGDMNDGQVSCLRELLKDVKRFASLTVEITKLSWKDLFAVRAIDYKGDEVKVARWFSWDNISPALPEEVGRVPLQDVCTLGCKEYVVNFDHYLKPKDEWTISTPPRVMVSDEDWPQVCAGLVRSGVCVFIPEHEIFHTDSGPLLNGLFGVPKDEKTAQGVEIYRLIMNLIPLNNLCKPMSGDVDSLPSWSTMSPFFLQPNERLLVSSEDVKCFFYTMSVPDCWVKFLAFNKLVPDSILPASFRGQRMYLASRVLPMGFLNSVSLAQHVHRNLAKWSSQRDHELLDGVNLPESELRKDRSFTTANPNWRIYLDNYDLLERVEATEVVSMEGTCPAGVLALRQEYERWEVPRNLKKSVQRSSRCELQGATVDGDAGLAYPRENKLAKYFGLALTLCRQEFATQKQWQVVCGGLVYFSMFRRPLLGGLTQVWQHILAFDRTGKRWMRTPGDCRLEILRFLGMLPLARLDFRLDMHPMVSCSDASLQGGGVCATSSLTSLGGMVSQGALRGEVPEPKEDFSVFSVGLFDGIGALRVALETINVTVLGHASVECNKAAQRVVEAHYPGGELVNSVQEVDEEVVRRWACRYSQCSLVLLGAGPPCQGVSGLNPDRKGALRDERSCLFAEIPRILSLLQRAFPWCPVHSLIESVGSMDANDRNIMSNAFGTEPILCDAGDFTWCHRPRLYWISWEIECNNAMSLDHSGEVTTLRMSGTQDLADVIRQGWRKVDETRPFPTFTTSRPRERPGRKPAGVHQCSLTDLERWHNDAFRFPPYQYKESNSLVNRAGDFRVPDVQERELMLGFPLHYTAPCMTKSQRKQTGYVDERLTLLGNTWSVPVVATLLANLFSWLGWIRPMTPQMVLDAGKSGVHQFVQGRLARLPLNPSRSLSAVDPQILARKLGNLVSIKGEDILLSTPTSQMVGFHRLRASIPSKLWKWHIITGWRWKFGKEHINGLELRAVLTALKWRLGKLKHTGCRMVHLTDSLVCLHTLSRGRSSSRKLRRTMARVNSLILAGNIQVSWAYVHTDDNPADRPSRWARRVKTKYRNAP